MVHETLKYLLTWVLGLTTSGLGVLCTVLVKRIKAQRKGLLALLHDRLYQSCRYYLAKGKVDVDGLLAFIQVSESMRWEILARLMPDLIS